MALQHLRSSTADKRPTPAAMSDGQLALNTNLVSPGLFFKDSNGDSVKIGPVHVGTTAPNATPGAGGQAGNSKGEAWLDTTAANPILKVWNGSAFVAVQPVGTGTVVSTTDTGTVTSTMILDGTILNADINASAAIVDTKLATISTAGKVSNSATTATNANTASAIVARDGSGNFTAGTITAALTGAASSNVLKAGDTMTGALVHPLGAVGTPSITFTGDLNTGIWSPAADTVAASTAGSERLRIDASGNVGIGTSSPQTTIQAVGAIESRSANTYRGIRLEAQDTGVQVLKAHNYLGASYNSYLQFQTMVGTSVTTAMTIDPQGRVGIGTASPQQLLEISASVPVIRLTDADGTNQYGEIQSNAGNVTISSRNDASNGAIVFRGLAANETARIDSSGRLLVGTSSAGGTELIQVQGTSGGSSLPGGIALRRSSLGNGDDIGYVNFTNASGNIHAGIKAFCNGTPGASDYPGALVFYTTADGASSPTERMRIASNGSIFFAATSESSITSGAADGKYINSSGEIYSSRATTGAASHIIFYNPNGFVGQIFTSGSATSYATASDYRLKENVTPLIGAIDRLQQIPVHRFNFIADPDTVVDGFIAHEAQEVVPECASGTKDEVDDDGNPVYQGIDQSKIVPLLTAALQEAIAKIEVLEQRLNDAGIN